MPTTGVVAPGHTLVEALIALLLLSLLLHAAWAALRIHGRALSSIVARAGVTEAGALAHGLLRLELRAGVAGVDWRASGSDSVSLRAFRGVGMPCRVSGRHRGDVTVVYRGIRAPDPEKDSVLVLGREGGWKPVALTARRAKGDRCPGGPDGTVETWVLDGDPGDPVALRVFERGSFHLRDGAFRYRRGGGGRQPLTERLFDPEVSTLEVAPPDRVRMRLVVSGRSRGSGSPVWASTTWARESR